MIRLSLLTLLLGVALGSSTVPVSRADEPIPHHQDRAPGPALSPEEALKRFQVPDGFTVELVAAEPDLVNPVSMTFDARGRIWVTESLEYPRSAPGLGRDRVKILEDTDGDGKVDRTKIFVEGLNIPSGIAIGHGAVWIANAPDLLRLVDKDGDDRADESTVVLSGFGRFDTHELPNSLSWGPDGCLYGLNGVFNNSHIRHQGQDFRFNVALWRLNPRNEKFDLFAEGTSNPWGVAWDVEGSAFVSACVIDHLWHLTETGYYQRQAGAYPPDVWILPSVVDHAHQKAAYCGLHYYDSDAYPDEYRQRLYVGNIHGNALNVDVLEQRGASYVSHGEKDFLVADDAWFMPVSMQTGPDGCLYVLDWYDRYHCYQDARRDTAGIDRLKGRLYRIRHKDSPQVKPYDMSKRTSDELVADLDSGNGYIRDWARRLLGESLDLEVRKTLAAKALDTSAPRRTRLLALWTLISQGELDRDFHRAVLADSDPAIRAWGVRAAGNFGKLDPQVRDAVAGLISDPTPQVQVQVAVAARKIEGLDAVKTLASLVEHGSVDALLAPIVWQNLHPLLKTDAAQFVSHLQSVSPTDAPVLAALLPRLTERLAPADAASATALSGLIKQFLDGNARPEVVAASLSSLSRWIRSGKVSAESVVQFRMDLGPWVDRTRGAGVGNPLMTQATVLAAAWNDDAAKSRLRAMVGDQALDRAERLIALEAAGAGADPALLDTIQELLAESDEDGSVVRQAISTLGQYKDVRVGEILVGTYQKLPPDIQPQVIVVLCQRPDWSKMLVAAVREEKIPTAAVNLNQIRRLSKSFDKELAEQVEAVWGTVRNERNPAREEFVETLADNLSGREGDPVAGAAVFQKVCAQCHKLYGLGQDVGPDLTLNGRNSFEQLLSNVFDPSLVIGRAYQGRTVATTDGRVLSGLPVEDSPERVVLKLQGGKLETIPRDEIDIFEVTKLSLMPEEMEKQFTFTELVDLLTYLSLDKAPDDPTAKSLPGAPRPRARAGGN